MKLRSNFQNTRSTKRRRAGVVGNRVILADPDCPILLVDIVHLSDPPPYMYRGLCLLCLLKLGRVIRCVYNCVMAYGTFHYVIMHYQPF